MGLSQEIRRAITINGIASWEIIPTRHRWRVLRAFGMDAAPATISPRVWFGSTRVTIGRGSFINRECMFSTHAPITIGDNVDIGMRVTFVTGSHDIGTATRRAGKHVDAPIIVGSGSWIGAGATILPGVTIGDGAVIAAGAVVTADCEPNAVYGGVPARLLRTIDVP